MSSSRSSMITILGAVLVSGACTRQQPNYCATAPDHNCMELPPSAPDASISCSADNECEGTLVCDVSGSKKCVQCTASKSMACTGVNPVCGSDNSCHTCTTHEQCKTNVCLPDGSCAMEADVAYVTAGANGTNCTKDEPCGTLQDGLEQNRTYVKVAKGSVKGSTTIDHQIVTILADKGAILTIDNSQTGKPVLEIGDQVSVQIYDLEITGATGANGDGIQSEKNSTLSLIHVAIHDNDGIGIRIMNGILTVDQSSIFSNKAGGIRMFTANGGGTLFMIINNFIYHNGSTMSTVGGLSLLPVGASKLEFNTVADNTSSGSTSAGGVICN